MGPPVLFWQERPGLGGRPFTLLKFRSMTLTDSPDLVHDRDLAITRQRITMVGYWMRKTSLSMCSDNVTPSGLRERQGHLRHG